MLKIVSVASYHRVYNVDFQSEYPRRDLNSKLDGDGIKRGELSTSIAGALTPLFTAKPLGSIAENTAGAFKARNQNLGQAQVFGGKGVIPLETPTTREEQYRLWNNTHSATLEDYRLNSDKTNLYHPLTEPK